jgi:glutathione S-transferase
MKLYIMPFACSLASDIALREAGLDFELVKVERSKKTANGEDYFTINPKGYVPALKLDNGEVLTENIAVLQYIADRKPEKKLAPPPAAPERYRLQEWLAFISTEIHKSFTPLFNPTAHDAHKQAAKELIAKRFTYLQGVIPKQFLMGENFTVADCYLFTVLSWTNHVGIDLSAYPAIKSYMDRVAARPAVGAALQAEGALAAAK